MKINNFSQNIYNKNVTNNQNLNKSISKLGSGVKVQNAADNATWLAISEKMKSQTQGLNQAIRNANDGRSMLDTAEGALSQTHDILHGMRELAVQASNGTYSQSDRAVLQEQMTQMGNDINRISSDTEFNGMKLLDGSFEQATGDELMLHVGANSDENTSVSFANSSMEALGLSNIDLSSSEGAQAALSAIDDAISEVSTQRASIGASSNGLSHTISNLEISSQNITASASTITDTDMAKELVEYTKNKILAQSSEAMLAQTNKMSQNVLSLLQ